MNAKEKFLECEYEDLKADAVDAFSKHAFFRD